MDKQLKRQILQRFEHYRLYKYLSGGEGSITTEQQAFVESTEQAVSRLPEMEQQVIQRRYLPLEGEYLRDYTVYEALGISQPFYAKARERAFEKLAAAFGLIEVEPSTL